MNTLYPLGRLSPEDIEKARQEAFNAAREQIAISTNDCTWKYKTYEDYKKEQLNADSTYAGKNPTV